MPDAFDPYRTWLGISPEEQPPNHYRLLGVPLFEDQPEAIEHAADRQMAHLHTLQTGEHAALSQRLLNEVAGARICLLNAEKKAAYDAQLRRQRRPPAAPARRPPVVAHAAALPGGAPDQETVQWTGLGQLGEYRLLEKLGAGGMGEVYKAVHTEMDRVVAVKVLPPGHLQHEHAVARFKREIKAVASLKHPNIVEAYDAREVEGTRFLVMEYVEGLDLRDVAKRLGPLPIPDACELIRQAALGLQCAHEHGLVHRDIKPGNLMLTLGSRHTPCAVRESTQGVATAAADGTRRVPATSEGHVKILDLGLARPQAEGAEEEVTGTGEAMGTADFMAPEQAQDSRSVDIRADLYSLGCTLYRLVAGRPPFSGPKYDTAVKKLIGHIQDPVPPITRFRTDVPKRLEIVLGRLLAKDPAKRLHTPAEVAEALAPLSAGSDLAGLYARAMGRIPAPPAPAQAEVPTHSRPSSGLTRFFQRFQGVEPKGPDGHATAAGPPQRTPAWAGYAAIAAVALLIILVWGVWSSSRPTKEAPVGQASSLPASQDKRPSPTHPKTQHLLLHWPASQRTEARLEIDRWPRPVADLVDRKDPDLLKLEVTPGPHKVWIERRGFEPFERTVKVEPGKDLSLRPDWAKPPEVAVVPPAKPEPKEPKPAEGPKPKDVAEKPAEPQERPRPPEIDPAEQERRRREARYADALAPAEASIAKWDFAGAAAALEKLSFDEPELSARLGRRRGEVRRMAALKARIVAKINAARPPLKKSALMIKGMNGDVVRADESGITTKLSSGKGESFAWDEIGTKAPQRLVALVIDGQDADDWLAAGLLSLASGDTDAAEDSFAKARELGTDIGPYFAPLAAAAFAKAEALLDKKDFTKAEAALADLEQKYGEVPWFAANRKAFNALRDQTKRSIAEAEAERLYAEAVDLYGRNELFDVRTLVERLKNDYPRARPVTDTTRKPSFADLEQAVANLGNMLTVRQDGKGDFKSIQAAIGAAEPGGLIEIQDDGPYSEKVVIPAEKAKVTLRGKRGCWPVITSSGAKTDIDVLVRADGPGTTLERLVVLHTAPRGQTLRCVSVEARGFRLRHALVFMHGSEALWGLRASVSVEDSIILAIAQFEGAESSLNVTNCLWVAAKIGASHAHVRSCTVPGSVVLGHSPNAIVDSIMGQVKSIHAGTQIDSSDLFPRPPSGPEIRMGRGCLSADPQFRDPANLDYRLLPTSPCIRKASDGGDIGCRYTPEMIELCKKAAELRNKGILKF